MSKWLSVNEAAAHATRHLGRPISPEFVQRWLDDGLYHARLAGTTIRIAVVDLDDWMREYMTPEQRRKAPNPPAAGPALRPNLVRKR